MPRNDPTRQGAKALGTGAAAFVAHDRGFSRVTALPVITGV
jgi:hypothetical protein